LVLVLAVRSDVVGLRIASGGEIEIVVDVLDSGNGMSSTALLLMALPCTAFGSRWQIDERSITAPGSESGA